MCAEDLAGCLQTLTVEKGAFSCVWGTWVLGFSSVLCPWWSLGRGSESKSWEQGLAAPPTASQLRGVSWTWAQGPPRRAPFIHHSARLPLRGLGKSLA